ncbi:BtrH N-terminal domain-containing protein [Paenibacillus sp. WLX2291]|uniref:BtrH N-terminal domain-containing protein n=1 Tax=Paenibacillus sp. WLX2291 TaxID=3296934 RepID=UPI0039843CCE
MSTDHKTLVPLSIDVLGVNDEEVAELIRSVPLPANGQLVVADLLNVVDGHFVINHCFYGAMRAMLNQQGSQLEETDIYFLCNGPSLRYRGGSQYDTFGLRPIVEMLQEWSEHTGIGISYTSVEPEQRDQAEILREWYDVLSSGKTLLLHVETANLVYNQLFTESPGKGHIIQLYGLQPSDNIAHIADHFLLDQAGQVLGYNGTIPLHELLEGVIEYGYLQSEQGIDVTPQTVLSAAAIHIEEFLNGGLNSDGYTTGIAAYGQLNAELASLRELDDVQFEETCGVVYYHLRIESLMHLLRYTSQFAERYRSLLGDNAAELVNDLQQVQEQARRQLMKLYKMGARRDRSKLDAYMDSNIELLETMALKLEALVTASKDAAIIPTS